MIVGSYGPHLYQPTPYLDALATGYHRGVMKHLGRQLGPAIKATELFELYQCLAAKHMPATAAAWQPELGVALRATSADSLDEAVVNALLALHALRVPGNWEYCLPSHLRLSIAGHLFDANGRISVRASAQSFSICRLDEELEPLTMEWTEAGLRYRSAQAPDARWRYVEPRFLTRKGSEHIYLQSCSVPESEALPDMIAHWPIPPSNGKDAALAATYMNQVEDALDLLAQAGSNYLPWLSPLFRGMAICRLIAPGMRQSESFSYHPGVFSCGFPLSTEFLSEVFVHEMSHQHYFLVNSIVPLTDKKSSGEIYFSTLKGRKRNLDKILMTYHATSNMVLFWHDVIVSLHMATEENLAEREVMVRHTRGLAQILATADGLTEAGRAMLLSQAELMNERGYGIKLN